MISFSVYVCIYFQTGLIYESQSSKIDLKKAEEMLLSFLKKYVLEGCCPLAGNTVYKDRLFLMKWMPLVNSHTNYRIIDISSVKELVRLLLIHLHYSRTSVVATLLVAHRNNMKIVGRRWNPRIYENVPDKQLAHRALPDIKESIQELKYYKENIFIHSIV